MKKNLNIDLTKEVEAIIAFVCICIDIYFGNYTEPVFGYKWANIFYSIAPFIFVMLIGLQIVPIINAVRKLDYIKCTRKVALSLLVAVTVVCLCYFPIIYKNYAFAYAQPSTKFKTKAKFSHRKGSRKEYIDFQINGKPTSLQISHARARQLEKGQESGVEYCVILDLKRGLDSTFVIAGFEIVSCK